VGSQDRQAIRVSVVFLDIAVSRDQEFLDTQDSLGLGPVDSVDSVRLPDSQGFAVCRGTLDFAACLDILVSLGRDFQGILGLAEQEHLGLVVTADSRLRAGFLGTVV
jgi:hypothetical protein